MRITIEPDLPNEKREPAEVISSCTAYLVAYSTGGNIIVRPGQFPLIFQDMKVFGLDPRTLRHGLLDLELALSKTKMPPPP